MSELLNFKTSALQNSFTPIKLITIEKYETTYYNIYNNVFALREFVRTGGQH